MYGCANCSGCPHKSKRLYKYDEQIDADKNKMMKINEYWEELQVESHINILSEEGILNCQMRFKQKRALDFCVQNSKEQQLQNNKKQPYRKLRLKKR